MNTIFIKTKYLVASPAFARCLRALNWWLHAIFLPFLVTRIFLLLVAYGAWIFLAPLFVKTGYVPGHTNLLAFSWEVWKWFDSYWYLSIVEHGYAPGSALHQPTNWAFYPLYPLLISLVGRLFGSTDLAHLAAGLLIANGAALIALSYLYLLVERDFSKHIAQRALYLLLAFPTAFYFSALYPESLWLALAIACLYYARQRRWHLAGPLGALAAATRPQGLGLLLPLLWEYWRMISAQELPATLEGAWQKSTSWWRSRLGRIVLAAKRWRNWRDLLWICCVPLGVLGFYTYAWLKTGDFFAELDTERWGWARTPTLPWLTIWHAFQHPVPFSLTDWNAWPVNMAAIMIFTLLLLCMPKRLPGMYILYTAVMIFLPLASGQIAGISRYYLLIFPAQILLARWSVKEHRVIFYCDLIICLIAQAFAMASFVLGFPFIA